MFDHSLLQPNLTDAEMEAGLQVARAYDVASVCIKPYYVRRAAEVLTGSGVKVCTVMPPTIDTPFFASDFAP